MIIAVILCPPDLVLLVRSGPVIRNLGGSVRFWGDIAPVLISYFYDGAVPAVFIGLSHDGTKSSLFGLAGGSPRRSSNGGKSESVDPTVCPRHPGLYWFGFCSRSRLLTERFLNSSTGPTF